MTRHNWSKEEVLNLFALPFNDLLFRAAETHRRNFDANKVQISTLLSIKTGGCAEDCAYCPQSAHFDAGIKAGKLLEKETILHEATKAKESGATRFCMGAAWRQPKDRDVEKIAEIISDVKALGMETCATLGMLTKNQAEKLKNSGLDYYNHNLDTSPEYYGNIITTRTYNDRLETLSHVREAGMNICCGGIVGLGENIEDRAGLLIQLANMEIHPESVPINRLVQVEGTKLYGNEQIDDLDFVRTIAVARILMPESFVRLSAGRETMSDELQALCFFAGANSIFYGEKLLTTENPHESKDRALFARLGISPLEIKNQRLSDAA